MSTNPKRASAAAAFYEVLGQICAREWKTVPVTVTVIPHPALADPFAIAAARTFSCPAWQAQSAALDAMLPPLVPEDYALPTLRVLTND
ncbi:hypothetical protein [Paraburkholderia tropica]|uniref:hypothetical protein n=1 Tax=Paraburkholderia tropica TaxID=92647 RepID=UPI002AB03AD4|nr:hypothetical protein [Paraburkholderia tropica]